MKNAQPSAQAVVIGIDVLCVERTAHTDASPQVDGLMADTCFPRKSGVSRMAIHYQQDGVIDNRWQTMQQLLLA